jgi:hypothetical protein
MPLWLPQTFDDSVQPWTWGISVAERSARLLLRSLRDRSQQEPACAAAIPNLSAHLGRIVAMRDAFEAEIGSRLRRLTGATGDLQELDDGALTIEANNVFGDLQMRERLGELMRDVFETYRQATEVPVETTREACCAIEVIGGALTGPQSFTRAPDFRFLRLGPDVDGSLAPGLKQLGGAKLYGTAANHFGAFGRQEWRAWDWMWGRLDAVAHLCRLLMEGAEDADVEAEIRKLQDLVLECEPAATPPAATPPADGWSPTLQDRRNWVARQLQETVAKPPDLLATLRDDRATLVETVLRFAAGSDTATAPRPVRALGRWLNLLLAQRAAVSLTRRHRVWRGVVRPLRSSLWKRLGVPAPDPLPSASQPGPASAA